MMFFYAEEERERSRKVGIQMILSCGREPEELE